MGVNRAHVAAILRTIADETFDAWQALPAGTDDERRVRGEAAKLTRLVITKLRLEADEIGEPRK
jgi:hypothetical protein